MQGLGNKTPYTKLTQEAIRSAMIEVFYGKKVKPPREFIEERERVINIMSDIDKEAYRVLFEGLPPGSVIKVTEFDGHIWEETFLVKAYPSTGCVNCAAMNLMTGEIWYPEDFNNIVFEVIKHGEVKRSGDNNPF